MGKEKTYTINEFEKEVITLHTTTLIRLYKLSSDATNLYLFYIKNAKIQETNSIYSTDSFCKKGLNWGEKRFRSAKTILANEGFIEQITKRDEKGIILGHYIKIHYLSGNKRVEKPNNINTTLLSHSVDEPTVWMNPQCGFQQTNALDKNINADDKNINADDKKITITQHEEIFNFWNSKNLTKHKILSSEMKKRITIALDKSFTLDQIKEAITNYDIILNSSDYYFDCRWALNEFIQRGSTDHGFEEKKGFQMFLMENKPFDKFKNKFNFKPLSEIDQLRSEFKPITKEYDQLNVLNKETNTYYGFSTDKLRNSYLMREYVADIKDNYNKSKFMLGDFCYLEEAIASIFFSRKSGYDMELLKALMSIWKEMKPKFKRKIIDLL